MGNRLRMKPRMLGEMATGNTKMVTQIYSCQFWQGSNSAAASMHQYVCIQYVSRSSSTETAGAACRDSLPPYLSLPAWYTSSAAEGTRNGWGVTVIYCLHPAQQQWNVRLSRRVHARTRMLSRATRVQPRRLELCYRVRRWTLLRGGFLPSPPACWCCACSRLMCTAVRHPAHSTPLRLAALPRSTGGPPAAIWASARPPPPVAPPVFRKATRHATLSAPPRASASVTRR